MEKVLSSLVNLDCSLRCLSLGTYIISVTDTNDCMIRDTIIITSPNSPLQALTSL